MADEKRLIDANDALGVLCNYCGVEGCCPKGGCAEYQKISKLPTVEAVEVVHASWIDEFGGKYANPKYICSNCTLKALYKEKLDVLGNWQTVQALTDYCPNCGAKMDGDGNVASE